MISLCIVAYELLMIFEGDFLFKLQSIITPRYLTYSLHSRGIYCLES